MMKSFNLGKFLAAGFLSITLGLLVWVVFSFKNIVSHVDSNIFSLLPSTERNQTSKEFINRISKSGEKNILILIGSNGLERSLEAEKYFRYLIKGLPVTSSTFDNYSDLLAKLNSHKSGLLTPEDITKLNSNPPNYWYERSKSLAYSLGTSTVPWKDDPFGLLNDWLYKLGKVTMVRPYGDSLVVEGQGRSFAVISLSTGDSVNSIRSQNYLADKLDNAITDTKEKFPGLEVVKSGIIFFASATTKSVETDVSIIGSISGILILVLIFFVFRSLYAAGIVFLTILVAFLYAVLACYFLYPKIYIMTIAFGTSLIGMSADYCLYWLTASIRNHSDTFERRRYLMPGMFLALTTTAMGYLLMTATPFEVLSQMAIFSVSGIVAAWLTVILLFPYIDRLNFGEQLGISLAKHIQLIMFRFCKKFKVFASIIMAALSLYGLQTIKIDDDLRSMANLDKNLIFDQSKAASILGIPSPSQFFVVTTSSEQNTLQRTERLTNDLEMLIADGLITGYQAITQFVPSVASQMIASQAYISHNKEAASRLIAKEFGMNQTWVQDQVKVDPPLIIDDLQGLPIYQKLSYLWFDSKEYGNKSTVVLLTGLNTANAVQVLAKLSDNEVFWVNKTQEVSEEFGKYRSLFTLIIAASYLLTFLILFIRFGKNSWRAIVPPLLATLITLAILSFLNEPISLLTVIAFALLLGVGTDYGIFLLQYPGDKRILLSITVAALMTVISFGSLSFSSIPALNSFGITLLFGVFLSWLLALFFARQAHGHA